MTTAVRPQRPGTPMRPAMAGRPAARRVRAVAASAAAPLVMLVPVALMVAVLAFRVHEAVPSVSKFLRPALLFGTGGFFFLVLRATPDQRARLTADPLVKLTAVYLLWGLASAPLAIYIGGAIDTFKIVYTIIFIAGAFAMLPANERALDFLTRAIALTGAAVGIVAVIQNQSWQGRLSFGGSLDANDLAAVMAVSTALALGAARRGKGLSKLIFLACAAVTASVVFKTGSRGGFLSLLLTAAVFVLAVPGAKRILWLSVAGLGLVAFWFSAPQATRDRFTTLTDLENDYNATAYFGREEIWKRGVGYALHNPILGVGLGNFETAEGESIARDGWHGKWSTAHNAYVQAAAELGIPGLLMFVLMVWRATVAGFRWTTFDKKSGVPPDRARPELLAAVLGMAGAIYFLSFAYAWIVFSILALAQLADRTRLAQRRARASAPARA